MNREEVEKFYETIEDEIHKISSNEAYINSKSYFGLSSELLSYIRKLEIALDEIEKYIKNHKRETESHIYGLAIPKFVFDGDIEDVEEIIEKAKGE